MVKFSIDISSLTGLGIEVTHPFPLSRGHLTNPCISQLSQIFALISAVSYSIFVMVDFCGLVFCHAEFISAYHIMG